MPREGTAMDIDQRRGEATRLYHYVGPADILARAKESPSGAYVTSLTALDAWVATTHQRSDATAVIPATFVVDAHGDLRLADRHSEHIACAGGQPVRSAGEIFLARRTDGWEVTEISNQSTGYCPDPESWPQVAAALARIPLPHPGRFTFACIFRRCPLCSQLNLVKDDVFECGVCGADLPTLWNLDPNAAR